MTSIIRSYASCGGSNGSKYGFLSGLDVQLRVHSITVRLIHKSTRLKKDMLTPRDQTMFPSVSLAQSALGKSSLLLKGFSSLGTVANGHCCGRAPEVIALFPKQPVPVPVRNT